MNITFKMNHLKTLVIILLNVGNIFSQACTGTQVTINLQNPATIDANTFEYDVYINNTGSTALRLSALGGGITSLPTGIVGATTVVTQPSGSMNTLSPNNALATAIRWTNNPAAASTFMLPAATNTFFARLRYTRSSGTALTLPMTLSVVGTTNQAVTYCNGNGTSATQTIANAGLIAGTPVLIPAAPLPIKIRDLSAFVQGKRNVINWTTESEFNNEVQLVEASINGINGWRTIAKVKSKNSASGSTYEAFDNAPKLLTYYRIRSIDFDGISQNSDVVYVQREAIKTSRLRGLSPIPAVNFLVADVELAKAGNIDYVVIDAIGKVLLKTSFAGLEGGNNINIDINNIPAGTYTIIISGNELKATEQFIKH